MTETVSGSGMVSWEVVDALYEHHFDCLRKIGFFVKAGDSLGEEGTALEVIAEFLKRKEDELQELRQGALAERNKAQSAEARSNPPNQAGNFGPDLDPPSRPRGLWQVSRDLRQRRRRMGEPEDLHGFHLCHPEKTAGIGLSGASPTLIVQVRDAR